MYKLCGNSLEIDFVYLKSCLEDPRCQYSASQQVLKNREGTEGVIIDIEDVEENVV